VSCHHHSWLSKTWSPLFVSDILYKKKNNWFIINLDMPNAVGHDCINFLKSDFLKNPSNLVEKQPINDHYHRCLFKWSLMNLAISGRT
jgi:hypothetical protein